MQVTSATLGEDCGSGGLPDPPAPAQPKKAAGSMQKPMAPGAPAEAMADSMLGQAPCQQTSLQLSVVAGSGAAATALRVTKVELFDEKGKRIGELGSRTPMVWADGLYKPWDETVAAGQSLSVSYSLSQPDWSGVADRFNKTYVVKVVVSVDGADQPLQREVYLQGATQLPPGVVT